MQCWLTVKEKNLLKVTIYDIADTAMPHIRNKDVILLHTTGLDCFVS